MCRMTDSSSGVYGADTWVWHMAAGECPTGVQPRGQTSADTCKTPWFHWQRMDARSVVYPHRELGFGLKRKEAPSQATRWVTLKDFMLVEISRSQNRHCRCHLTKESSRIHRDTKEWGSLGGGGWAVPAPRCPGLMSCVPSRFLCRSPTPSGTVIGDGPQGGDPVNPDGEGGVLRGPSPSLSLSLPLPLPSLSLSPPFFLPPPFSLPLFSPSPSPRRSREKPTPGLGREGSHVFYKPEKSPQQTPSRQHFDLGLPALEL